MKEAESKNNRERRMLGRHYAARSFDWRGLPTGVAAAGALA
jgi:hypothetical protein